MVILVGILIGICIGIPLGIMLDHTILVPMVNAFVTWQRRGQ